MKRVAKEKAFYFFSSIGNYTGKSASSIDEFLEKVREVEIKSLRFHLQRVDFEKWMRDVWGKGELAQKLKEIRKSNLKDETLRNQIERVLIRNLKMGEENEKSLKEQEYISLEEFLKQPIPEEHAFELRMEKKLKRSLAKRTDEKGHN